MRHSALRLTPAILLTAMLFGLAVGCPPRLTSRGAEAHGIRNFGEVVPGRIYRSGRISEDGFRYLFGHGLKSVINLRAGHDDLAKIPPRQRDFYHRFRIPDHMPPTDEQMAAILDVAREPDSWPVLIHCSAGRGRAGTVVAVLRYSLDGWPVERALGESLDYRGGEALNDADVAFVRRWAQAHAPGEWGTRPRESSRK